LTAKLGEEFSIAAEPAAEKLDIWFERRREHTSAAKAGIDSIGIVPGMNPRPTARMSFSAGCKGHRFFSHLRHG
jgi:hypothetical protein